MRFLFYFWALSAVPALLLSAPVVALGWRRVRWHWWELLAIVLPFAAWGAAYALWPAGQSDKGIGNLFNEPILVGLLVPAAALLRTVAASGRQTDQRSFAATVQVGLCVAAALIRAWPNMHGTI